MGWQLKQFSLGSSLRILRYHSWKSARIFIIDKYIQLIEKLDDVLVCLSFGSADL
jgi:hypothetical protein